MVVRAPWVAALLASTRAAAADPIVDRDYAIELYEGVAIGNTAQVGMGGAGAAVILGSAGALLDAAAPAIRETTDRSGWSWDYHLDFLTGKYSSDYDNNGVVARDTSGAQLLTAGLALRIGNWGTAITVTDQVAPVAGSSPALEASALRGKLVVARWFPRLDLSAGVGVQTVGFALRPEGRGNDQALFALTGAGVLAGVTWLPREENYRASVALESAIAGGQVTSSVCDPMNCMGYILPNDVASPARMILGTAFRLSPTAWNQLVPTRFRDERALTIATDVVFTGTSANAHGIEAFGMQQLQPSGRRISVSVRAGGELEALPGRLRVRAGAYWEPGRFEDVDGRLHGTLGVDVRVFQFQLWGLRRGRISGIADVAAAYRNIGLSVGFWH
ncbi:MAG: hypothetical protein KF773_22235 [Deltaproteobacteria bacterium]|nr:hypothetical protein [Deltaproteobacteria bacterium]MCW5802434.1 hypothetical protein [Deltaproteobacteria bacterium]